MNHAELSQRDYHSYLMRLWREGAQAPWRVSLQSTATEQLYHFATIEALFAFLAERLVDDEDEIANPPGAG
jgi:hypothetical protein